MKSSIKKWFSGAEKHSWDYLCTPSLSRVINEKQVGNEDDMISQEEVEQSIRDSVTDADPYKIRKVIVNPSEILIYMTTKFAIVPDSPDRPDSLRLLLPIDYRVEITVNDGGSTRTEILRCGDDTHMKYGAYGYLHLGHSLCKGTWAPTIDNAVDSGLSISLLLHTIYRAMASRNPGDTVGRRSFDMHISSLIIDVYGNSPLQKNAIMDEINSIGCAPIPIAMYGRTTEQIMEIYQERMLEWI